MVYLKVLEVRVDRLRNIKLKIATSSKKGPKAAF